MDQITVNSHFISDNTKERRQNFNNAVIQMVKSALQTENAKSKKLPDQKAKEISE